MPAIRISLFKDTSRTYTIIYIDQFQNDRQGRKI